MTRYASVYPLVTARALAREFTYEIPDDVGPGAVVEVRFGNSKQRGVVTEVDVQPPKGIDTSPVERVVEELPRPLVELALWVADYYGSTPGRALTLVAPVQRKARGTRPQPAERDALTGEAEPAELSATQQAALERITGCARRERIRELPPLRRHGQRKDRGLPPGVRDRTTTQPRRHRPRARDRVDAADARTLSRTLR